MTYKTEMIDQPAQITLTIRTRSAVKDLPQLLPSIYRQIGDYLKEVGQKPAGVPFAAYYNMDMDDMDVEAGVATATQLPGRGDIQPSTIPAARAAACLYVGPYDGLPKGYDALMTWMKEQGIEGSGTAFEVYLSDPMEVAPEALETQIVMPVKFK